MLLLLFVLANGDVKVSPSSTSSSDSPSLIRSIIAGGLSGGIANALFYPIDTIKIMRQSDPKLKNPGQLIARIVSMTSTSTAATAVDVATRKLKIYDYIQPFGKLYSGFFPSVLGSMPSSAIYFGAYEFSKTRLYKLFSVSEGTAFIHMLAAASGNVMSSFVFVPKDAIKSQMQAYKTGSIKFIEGNANELTTVMVIRNILKKNGIKGFYPSYRATLLRNIPSAVIRFTMYEELRKYILSTYNEKDENGIPINAKYLIAGAISSGISSFVTTPLDVMKTRYATGLLDPKIPIFISMYHIAKKEGIESLFAGAQVRILLSSLFGGIGFTCFEYFKKNL